MAGERYQLQPNGMGGVDLFDAELDIQVSVVVAKNRLNRGEAVAKAGEAVLAKLDYLQGLWGKEGVTHTLAEQLRAALYQDGEGD